MAEFWETVRIFLLQWGMYALAVVPFYVALRLAWRRIRRPMANQPLREALLAALCLYLVFVFSSTVAPQVHISSAGLRIYWPDGEFAWGGASALNLAPGKIFVSVIRSFASGAGLTFWVGFLGNLLLLAPVGLLSTLLFWDSLPKELLLGLAISLFIELFQLFLPRATDIDDLWMNAAGMMLGWAAGRGIMNRWPGAPTRLRAK